MIKVVSFDVGHTLIKYNNPLSWTSLYRPALCEAAAKCNIVLADGMMDAAAEILKDFAMLTDYIDLILTSVDVGCRKPCKEGFLKTAECFNILPNEMIYVGDEEKDIVGANSVGAVSVLINRSKLVANG